MKTAEKYSLGITKKDIVCFIIGCNLKYLLSALPIHFFKYLKLFFSLPMFFLSVLEACFWLTANVFCSLLEACFWLTANVFFCAGSLFLAHSYALILEACFWLIAST